MEIVNQRAPREVPSSAEWSKLQPVITDLYQGRRWTMIQVRDHLNSMGYRVNTRMVRGRITQWNLQRNNQVRDMRAALCLLSPDPALWPSAEPSFLIRGRKVTIGVILNFFRRKGIQNPIEWAHSTIAKGEEPTVTLLDAGSTNEIITVGSHVTSSTNRTPPFTQPVSPLMQIVLPEQRAVDNLHGYYSAYVSLGHASAQQEPPVHQFTIHGRFGNLMQEGLAQMVRGGPGAFPNFRRGFDVIQDLLSECHPMSMAQFLAVVCELAARGAHAVLSSLLRYTAMMASSLRVSSLVIEFLSALRSSVQIAHVAIASLRAGLGAFTQQQPDCWKRLYIQDRLCDCLYHSKARSEGSTYRVQLLRDQEAFYGSVARVVLWTLTNVADDQLHLGNVDDAKVYYNMALARSLHQTGFARAKIRFAALEGMARTEQALAEQMIRTRLEVARDPANFHLREAFRYIDEALREALIWFEPSSRRIVRATELRSYLSSLLANFDRQEPLKSCLNDADVIPWHDSSKT